MTELNNVTVDKTEDERLDEKKVRDWSIWRQHLVALLANLASLSAGLSLGWTSPALPLLQREEPNVNLPLYVTVEQGSWISCLCPLGAAVGALPAGKMADCMGRKKAVLSLAVPFIFGWLFILFADDSVAMVYAGRFIGGLAVGASSVLIAQYNEEIAEDSIRGQLGVYLDFNQCLGVLLINLFGCFMSYATFTITSSIIPLVFIMTFIWMPESPMYLLQQGRDEDAKKSLTWLRKGKQSYSVDDELKCFKEYLSNQQEIKDTRPIFERLKELTFQSVTLKTVSIVFGLMFFQQVGGINGILFNAVSIFNSAGSKFSSNASSALLGLCMCISELCSSLYVDRLGRRPMLLISAFVTAICQAVLSVYFHFLDRGYNMEVWSWIPLTSLIIFMIGFTSGFGPLVWLLNAELVPTNHQTWASPLASSLNWAMAFLVTKTFPDMQATLKSDGTYGLYSFMCVLSFIFVWYRVPETKGKSREEIVAMLTGQGKE